MAMSIPLPEGRATRMRRRILQMLLILAIVLVVFAVLFVIVYGVGIQHHHSNTNQGAMMVVARLL